MRRTDIIFPLRDRSDCIVPFDRSRIPDRRQQNLAPGENVPYTPDGIPWSDYREADASISTSSISLVHDAARNFSISGELIAIVNNLYTSRSPGRWKELELYRTRNSRYVCLEIWRTTWKSEQDQYWLVTCDDLKAAREFFGNNGLAHELFSEAMLELREQGD